MLSEQYGDSKFNSGPHFSMNEITDSNDAMNYLNRSPRRQKPLLPPGDFYVSKPQYQPSSRQPQQQTFESSNEGMPNSTHSQLNRRMRDFNVELQQLKEEKRRKLFEQELEKKQNLYLLENYYPWGKPGGGAPRGETEDDRKKMKFREEDLHLDLQTDQQEGLKFHSPGGGAPIRDSQGRVVTEISGDPLLRFRTDSRTNRVLTEPIRYKVPPQEVTEYAKQLERSIFEKAAREQQQRQLELQEERQTWRYDPFGKPGAGAPNLPTPRNNPNPDGFVYDPWGKGHGQPRRDAEGNVERYKFHDIVRGNPLPPTVRVPESVQNHDSLIQNSPVSLQMSQQRPPFKEVNQNSQHPEPISSSLRTEDAPENLYFPFGSPGGGAPHRDKDGNIVTKLVGLPNNERDPQEDRRKALAAKLYNNELEYEVTQHKLNLLRDRQNLREPIGDMSEILKQGRTGRPRRDERTGLLLDHPLNSSDVTGLRKNVVPSFAPSSNEFYQSIPIMNQEEAVQKYNRTSYGLELEKAAEERRRMRELERMHERQEVNRHLQAFNEIWGRPGGGAPRSDGTNMINFERALHNPSTSMMGVRNNGVSPYSYY